MTVLNPSSEEGGVELGWAANGDSPWTDAPGRVGGIAAITSQVGGEWQPAAEVGGIWSPLNAVGGESSV